MKEYAKIIVLFIIIILVVKLVPKLNDDYVKTSKLYISEIMASNSYTIKDEDGDYSDYIEIYNGYNYKIDLDGYFLSDDEFNPQKWMFSDIVIEPGEYILIYASGKDKDYHTNFKLNSENEEVVFSDNNGNIISKVLYDNMLNDISYGYTKGKYIFTNQPTPKEKNSNIELKEDKHEYDILINEYMANNKRNYYSEDGYYYDWVELYNNENKDITINNLYLTDDINVLSKYKIPPVEIKSKEYLIIYLSGESSKINEDIFANFKISKDEELILSNGQTIIDKVKIIELPENISYGKKDNKWYYFTNPTPGNTNNTAGHEKLGEAS
ncbi:MAG: lamin tail domain-containing protein [Bacilli bacterium]|nr:lamin tail domain-containing protein [Bacilli bacterium]